MSNIITLTERDDVMWVISKNELQWMKLYLNATGTQFLGLYGYGYIELLRIYTFESIIEIFENAWELDRLNPGFPRDILRDFYHVLLMTHDEIIFEIIHTTTYTFNLSMWKMATDIGSFLIEHQTFLLTSFFMRLSSPDLIQKELRALATKFGAVFLRFCMPYYHLPLELNPPIYYFEPSRRFLRVLNKWQHKMNDSFKVISIAAKRLEYFGIMFDPSAYQKRLWIDFNLYNPCVNVWAKELKGAEANFNFKIRDVKFDRRSRKMTLLAIFPVQVIKTVDNVSTNYIIDHDKFIFTLTKKRFRYARKLKSKIEKVKMRRFTI